MNEQDGHNSSVKSLLFIIEQSQDSQKPLLKLQLYTYFAKIYNKVTLEQAS